MHMLYDMNTRSAQIVIYMCVYIRMLVLNVDYYADLSASVSEITSRCLGLGFCGAYTIVPRWVFHWYFNDNICARYLAWDKTKQP